MEAIANYSDKSHAGVRSYVLYPDHIVVVHRDTVRGTAESRIRLRELNPDYEKIAVRTVMLWAGVWILIVSSLIYWALIELTRLDPFGRFAGFFLTMALVGVFVAAVGLRRERLVRFRSMGGVPALEVFREGPKKMDFDVFVAHLEAAIRQAHLK